MRAGETGPQDASTPAPTPGRTRRRLRPVGDTRHRRRRLISYCLLAGAAVLMVNALVGENGYFASIRARREYDAVMSDLVKLRLENQALKEQARRLKGDPTAIEEAARRELGLIRPGETLVIVRDKRTAGSQ